MCTKPHHPGVLDGAACQFVFYFSAGTRYTVVGYKLAGLLGAIVAIIATIIPPFVIITVISYFYELFRDNFIVSKLPSGMQAGVGAVIASVVWDMGGGVLKQKSAVSDFIMVAAFLAACVFRVNVVYIVLACIALGVLRTVLAKSSP
ncbi:MAG: chromate transporter [Firmicutes bacterium]|nr:chromate transporter [Bacillota bacterium]